MGKVFVPEFRSWPGPRYYVLASRGRHEAGGTPPLPVVVPRILGGDAPALWGALGRSAAVRPRRELDDPRRRILIQALAAGFFSFAGNAAAQLFGRSPARLPAADPPNAPQKPGASPPSMRGTTTGRG